VLPIRIGHGRPGYCHQRPNNISGGQCLDTLAQDELAIECLPINRSVDAATVAALHAEGRKVVC